MGLQVLVRLAAQAGLAQLLFFPGGLDSDLQCEAACLAPGPVSLQAVVFLMQVCSLNAHLHTSIAEEAAGGYYISGIGLIST